jgi:hypothetical protein
MKINSRFSNLLNKFAEQYGWRTTVQMRKALSKAAPTAKYTIGVDITYRAAVLLKILNFETFQVVNSMNTNKLKYF